MLHNKYNIFIWTHVSRLRYSDGKYWKYFPLLFSKRSPCNRVRDMHEMEE